MKKDKPIISKETVLQTIYIFIALLMSAFIATGLSFSFEVFKDPKYYISTLFDFFIMMITYKIIKHITLKQEKSKKEGVYYNTIIEYNDKLEYIKLNHLEEEVEIAVKKELEKRKNETIDHLLLKYRSTLNHLTVFSVSDEEIEKYIIDNKFSKRKAKRLRKIIIKCKTGDFKYRKFTTSDILIDVESKSTYHQDKMSMGIAEYNAIETGKRTLSFIFTAVLFKTLLFEGFSYSFFIYLFTELFMVLSSTVSGIFAANKYLQYRKQIIDNRINFLNRYIRNWQIIPKMI